MAGVACSQCGKALDMTARAAGISVFQQGDERIDSWFWCVDCGVWTLEEYLDVFIGESRITVRGPIRREAGEKRIGIIQRCPTPFDKWCECEAHREYERKRSGTRA